MAAIINKVIIALVVLIGTTEAVFSSDLHSASEQGDVESVRELLANGAAVDEDNNAGETALYVAAKKGHAEVVQLLLTNGADVEKIVLGHYGSEGTPLHAAIKWGHIDVVQVLLDAGANPNLEDRRAGTPLHIAVFRGNEKIERLLRQRGAKHVTVEPVDSLIRTASLEHGREIAVTCSVCHAMSEGAHTSALTPGPSLWNIVGRPKAAITGFLTPRR